MKILLINTNRMKPAVAPIGIDYIADALVQHGHEPRLLDLCFSGNWEADLRAAVNEFDPRLIGVTVRNTDECYMTGAFFLPFVKQVVDALRLITDAPIVMGGAGFSVSPGGVMRFCRPDYGIAGEGEHSFPCLANALQAGTGVESISNLISWDKDRLLHNPIRHLQLNSLRRTRSFVDNALYFREGGQAGIETRRGCTMKCVYCADPVSKGRHVRLRPPKLVVDELTALLAQGIDHFHTCDCEFNLPRSHANAVCREIIDSGIGDRIRWYAYCSITPFDEEDARLFQRAGCAGIDFGADSGDDAMLARLGREFRTGDLIRTAELCHEHDIPFMYDLLIGGPGETRESVRRTVDLMRRINAPSVGLSLGVRVYDGTPFAEWIRSGGDIAANPDLYGAKDENPDFLHPIFYVSPGVGPDWAGFVEDAVGGDPRFFLPSAKEGNYNYNDNAPLVEAIHQGARGAYWDILRRIVRGF